MEIRSDTTGRLSREGSVISRAKTKELDDQPASSSVSSSTLSRVKIDINLDSVEINLLEVAAQEDDAGEKFVTTIGAVSGKHGLHATDLVNSFCFLKSGDTLLHVALRNGKKEAVMFILDLVPSLLTIKNAAGETVWHVIASTGHMGVFLCLLFYRKDSSVNGYDLLDKNVDGNTALHVALINYQEEIAMTLWKMNPALCDVLNNEKRSGAYLAARAGCTHLLKAMPWSDQSESTANETADGAVIGKQLDVLKVLKSKSATLFSTPNDLKRALHFAVACGFIKGVEFFIELHGENVDVAMLKEDTLQRNLLHLAALGKDFELVLYILNKKAFKGMITEQDEEGNTPLHLAAMNCRFLATYTLALHRKVNLKQVNKEGLNALEAAELYTRRYFSISKWLTLSSLRAAGMRSSSPSKPDYPTKKVPDTATFDLSKSARKQVITILVVMLIVVAVSAFVGILASSYIGPAYNLTKSRRLRLAAWCNMSILLISILLTPSLILLHSSKYLQAVIFKLVVPFFKTSVTAILVQVVVIFYMAVRYLHWPYNVIPGTTLCLIGFLLSPFLPLSPPDLPFQRMIIRRITCYPLGQLLTLCHFSRK